MREVCFVYVREDLVVNIDQVEGFSVQHDGSVEVWLTTNRWGNSFVLAGELAERFIKDVKPVTIGVEKGKGGPRSTPLV